MTSRVCFLPNWKLIQHQFPASTTSVSRDYRVRCLYFERNVFKAVHGTRDYPPQRDNDIRTVCRQCTTESSDSIVAWDVLISTKTRPTQAIKIWMLSVRIPLPPQKKKKKKRKKKNRRCNTVLSSCMCADDAGIKDDVSLVTNRRIPNGDVPGRGIVFVTAAKHAPISGTCKHIRAGGGGLTEPSRTDNHLTRCTARKLLSPFHCSVSVALFFLFFFSSHFFHLLSSSLSPAISRPETASKSGSCCQSFSVARIFFCRR